MGYCVIFLGEQYQRLVVTIIMCEATEGGKACWVTLLIKMKITRERETCFSATKVELQREKVVKDVRLS